MRFIRTSTYIVNILQCCNEIGNVTLKNEQEARDYYYYTRGVHTTAGRAHYIFRELKYTPKNRSFEGRIHPNR